MKLSSLLEKLEYTCVQGSTEQEVTGVVYDSRKVTDGSLFICIRGAVVDGHKFIPDVTAKGAKVLIVEEEVSAPSDVTVIQVTDTRYAMAFISAAWFGHPAPGDRHQICYGIYFSGLVWTSGREAENNRNYRNQGKNHYYLYGKIHSGKCRIQGWSDRYY